MERAKHTDGDRSRDDGSRRRHAGAERQLRTVPNTASGQFLRRRLPGKASTAARRILEANCSWLPWLLWRLDEGWEREGDIWAPDLTTAPSEYFKRQCVISVEPDEATVKHVIDYMGGKTIVFSIRMEIPGIPKRSITF